AQLPCHRHALLSFPTRRSSDLCSFPLLLLLRPRVALQPPRVHARRNHPRTRILRVQPVDHVLSRHLQRLIHHLLCCATRQVRLKNPRQPRRVIHRGHVIADPTGALRNSHPPFPL